MRDELSPSNFVVPFGSAAALPNFYVPFVIFGKYLVGPGFFLSVHSAFEKGPL